MELPKITRAFLNVTDECNLRCTYCFVNKMPNFIDYQTAKDAVDFLGNNAAESKTIPNINFFGGEPMLMWDTIIEPLVLYAKEKYKNFRFSITTNGTLLNEERIKFMREHNFGLLLSIDGNECTQNINRPYRNGKGSFAAVQKNIPFILEHFPQCTFRSTVTPATVSMLFEDMMFAANSGFKNYFVTPNIFEHWSEDDLDKLTNAMNAYTDYYIDEFRKGNKPMFFNQMERSFNQILLRNRSIDINAMRSYNKCKACGKCGLGAGSGASIGFNGMMYACQELCTNDGEKSPFYIGNIYSGVIDERRQSLMNLWDSKQAYSDDCASCVLNRICDGGCVANNYLHSGDMHYLQPIYCFWSRLLFDSAVKVMTALGEEANVGFIERWKGIIGRK